MFDRVLDVSLTRTCATNKMRHVLDDVLPIVSSITLSDILSHFRFLKFHFMKLYKMLKIAVLTMS